MDSAAEPHFSKEMVKGSQRMSYARLALPSSFKGWPQTSHTWSVALLACPLPLYSCRSHRNSAECRLGERAFPLGPLNHPHCHLSTGTRLVQTLTLHQPKAQATCRSSLYECSSPCFSSIQASGGLGECSAIVTSRVLDTSRKTVSF